MARQTRHEDKAKETTGDINSIDREHLERRLAEPAAASLEADSEAGGGHAGPIPARRRGDVVAGRAPKEGYAPTIERPRPNAARWPDPAGHKRAGNRGLLWSAALAAALILLLALVLLG